jgi:hypothetical protein
MPDQQYPVSAGTPTRAQSQWPEDPINRQPQRVANQSNATINKSNAAAWVQAISIAVIALIMLIAFSFTAVTALKAQAALRQMQQYQSQNCGVNPSTGLVECR